MLLANEHDRPIGRTHAVFHSILADRIQEWADDAFRARERDNGSPALTSALVQAFVTGLSEVLRGTADAEVGQAGFRVNQCCLLVQQHLSDSDLSVRGLAEMLACAPDYLSHAFHQQKGETLSQYINRKRVEYGCALLGSQALNISEVAHAVGYTDPGYFTRQFRRQRG